jgi:flavin reductase (DIM6/NTAB) family NADH-FMN oxidoreductase RutF
LGVSTNDFDRVMASLDTPMIVVTTAANDERGGCLVGFHAQSSIDPGRFTVWLSKANHTYRVAQYATHLGVHFLAEGDHELAEHFGTQSGDDVDKFADRDVAEGLGGVPVLVECPNRMVARKVAILDEGGDHVCVVTEPVEVHSTGTFTPLHLSDVSDLDPGHDAEERDQPRTMRAN